LLLYYDADSTPSGQIEKQLISLDLAQGDVLVVVGRKRYGFGYYLLSLCR
jgi:hypothetical protein